MQSQWTPLHAAAMLGHGACFSLLLQADDEALNLQPGPGRKPVDVARGAGHAHIVQAINLWSRGAHGAAVRCLVGEACVDASKVVLRCPFLVASLPLSRV